MDQNVGQFVLNSKRDVSHDIVGALADVSFMTEREGATDFDADFKRRTKEARVARDLTQAEMAHLLGIDQGKYKQYETRTLLPHEFVEKFLLITGRDWEWLYTGRLRLTGRRSSRKKSAA